MQLIIKLQGVHRFAGITVEYPDLSGVGHPFVYSEKHKAHIYKGKPIDQDEFNKVCPMIFGSATQFWKPVPEVVVEVLNEVAPVKPVTRKPVETPKPRCAPPVINFAKANNVDLSKVTATGVNGYVLKLDVTNYIQSQKNSGAGVQNLSVHGHA
tara:strand:+ start:20833 stop:21294 length:462 start_codon:yes stop_codon:yes gene_type:complete